MRRRIWSTKPGRVLGIAWGERAATIAACDRTSSGTASELRQVSFPYPEGLTLDPSHPVADALLEQAGRHLGALLQTAKITATDAVLGLPARWLHVRTMQLPPADAAAARQMLHLQTSAALPGELGEMVSDFVGEPSPTEPSTVLVVSVARLHLQRLQRLTSFAGLRARRALPTATPLAQITATRAEQAIVLSLLNGNVELFGQSQGRLESLRHLGTTDRLLSDATGTLPLLPLLRRALASTTASPRSDGGPASASAPTLVLWDDTGSPTLWTALQDAALPLPIRRARTNWLSPAGGDAPAAVTSEPCDAGCAAVALAMSDGDPNAVASVDFFHPRLTPPRESSLPTLRGRSVLAGAAVLLLTAGITALWDSTHLQHQLDSLDGKLRVLEPAVQTGRARLATLRTLRSFQLGPERYLPCLGDLTQAVPADERAFLTSFGLRDDLSGTLAGQAVAERDVLTLMDEMKASGRFAKLDCRFVGRAGVARRGSRAHPATPANSPPLEPADNGSPPDVSFQMTFDYQPRR